MFYLSKLLAPTLQGVTVGDNIWFTYKARIQAHERLESNDLHSQFLLVWYALLSTILAVVTVRHEKILGPDTDIFSTSLSVVLLTVSLLVTSRDYRGRAIEMCRNYREIHALYKLVVLNQAIHATDLARYEELLNSVENHTEMDDMRFRVKNKGTLSSRTPTWLEITKVFAHTSLRIAILASLYAGPIVVIFIRYA
jgi:hypothetical protein